MMENRQIRYKSVKVGVIFLVMGVVLLAALALSTAHIGQAEGPFPPDKARRIALQQDEIATARAHPRKVRPPAILAGPMPTPQPGIFEIRSGPFSSLEFTVRNVWQGPVGSVWKTVYAGGTPKHPGSGDSTPGPGALRIYTVRADGSLDSVKTIIAPKGIGPLTITAVNGTTIQFRTDAGKALTDAGGNPLTFDLQKEQFTGGLQGEAITLKQG